MNRLDLYTRNCDLGLLRYFPPPLSVGGDCAGEVVETGDQVAGLKAGDRGVVNPKITCQQCPACLAGDDHLCPRPRFMGSAIDGCYAVFAVMPAANAHPIADGVSERSA